SRLGRPGHLRPRIREAARTAAARRDQPAVPHPVRLAHHPAAGPPAIRRDGRPAPAACVRRAARIEGRRRDRAVAAAPARRGVRRVQALKTGLIPIAVTAGEPAGIGPDLCLALAGLEFSSPLVTVGSLALLDERARLLGLTVELVPYLPGKT